MPLSAPAAAQDGEQSDDKEAEKVNATRDGPGSITQAADRDRMMADTVATISSISSINYLFPWPPEGVPKAFWQRLRSLRFLVYPYVGLYVTLVLFVVTSLLMEDSCPMPAVIRQNLTWLLTTANMYFLLPSGILVSFFARRVLRRFEQEVIAHGFEQCLECGYPLKGLPAEHRCPECGEPYDIATVKKTWERYFEAQRTKK